MGSLDSVTECLIKNQRVRRKGLSFPDIASKTSTASPQEDDAVHEVTGGSLDNGQGSIKEGGRRSGGVGGGGEFLGFS